MDTARFATGAIRRSKPLRNCWLAGKRVLPRRKSNRYPNLIIVGAQKCGTTSLHNYINQHPDVFMAHFKEPGLFLDDNDVPMENTTRRNIRLQLSNDDLLDLISFGYRGQPWFGESSTYYSMYPTIGSEVPGNIAKYAPDAKIIYIVRNPFSRIVSQYLWGLKNEFALGDFEAVVRSREKVMTDISRYAFQLQHFRDVMPEDAFLVLRFEMLNKDPAGLLKKVFDFLGISSGGIADYSFDTYYKSENRKNFSTSELKFPRDVFDRMKAAFEEDLAELAKVSGEDFSDWDLSADTWVKV